MLRQLQGDTAEMASGGGVKSTKEVENTSVCRHTCTSNRRHPEKGAPLKQIFKRLKMPKRKDKDSEVSQLAINHQPLPLRKV